MRSIESVLDAEWRQNIMPRIDVPNLYGPEELQVCLKYYPL